VYGNIKRRLIMAEHAPCKGIYLDGETEYIKVENGISGFFMCDKALSSEEILKRYEESKE
jgi:hypothetical protein